ncbi:MAG TPA: DUF2752 domain-containing protein [Stackebrandtia sp.]|uniref:DUF2752 domain-containing protein n=1 Tax=Stackebrandtia sp. TaxID=2023065 RepID=UPI002D58C320|nr:DUF2752 domain-containing protein [Stackebrandtia sp.]HZE38088.1 DUF2752 domain-containing protein [Stackebrandtia sp.]
MTTLELPGSDGQVATLRLLLPHWVTRTKWGPVMMWLGIAAAVAYVWGNDPADSRPDPGLPCFFHLLFGVNGPSCGGTRMIWYLLHGDLVQAFRYHAFALAAVPLAVYGLVWWTVRSWTGRRLPVVRVPPRVFNGYIIAWVVFTSVLRNLPFGPFTWFDIPDMTPWLFGWLG